MIDAEAGGPPAIEETLVASFRRELRSYVRPDRSRLIRVGLDVVICAALLVPAVPLGFVQSWALPYIGVVLVSWVLSDFASNLIGTGGPEVVERIGAGEAVGALLAGQNLALAALLLPVGVAVSAVAPWAGGRRDLVAVAAAATLGAAAVWLGVGDVVSVLAPRRAVPTSVLVRQRRLWRSEAGWAVVYLGTMFVLGPGVSLPAALLVRQAVDGHSTLASASGALGYSLVVWFSGLVVAGRIGARRRARIVGALEAPPG